MKNTIAVVVLGLGLAAGPMSATSGPLTVRSSDTVQTILEVQKGKRVTVKLISGEELTGIVKTVSGDVVHLAQLSGKEFYDAVVVTGNISALIIRTKD